MAEISSCFLASHHNKARTNRNFYGGSWRPFCTWRVAEPSWRRSRTTTREEKKESRREERKRRKKEKKEGEEKKESCATCWLEEEGEDNKT